MAQRSRHLLRGARRAVDELARLWVLSHRANKLADRACTGRRSPCPGHSCSGLLVRAQANWHCIKRVHTTPLFLVRSHEDALQHSGCGQSAAHLITYAASLPDAESSALLLSHAAKDDEQRGREARDFELRASQRDWLAAATKRCGARDVSVTLRWLLDGIIDSANEEVVFSVRRCANTCDSNTD